ncbi:MULTISPECIES: DUF2786 domain-containing protein [unclassified Sphingopyxis]|uniref:DUF7168 domain-containing protein n=1 Tax=unclassified Sphingopyxis TaxID=2614943 RepID=UPI00286039F0|nr:MULTISPECIES: DUF2786 domain-containing protein [unclassified Sphingopyxis]MDR7062030.1 hypothetical protein [Sphingopyxis sp. BE235]MDR7182488.1 hypothetical protein [Sphingopyxis sp. BE249]
MTDKAKIAARIRALREKTVANGCTEEEAAAAAAMVASMLAKYNMTLDECEVRESGFARSETVFDDPVGERLWKVADGIAHMIGVRYWSARPGCRPSVTFFGFEHEVEIATYLLEICRYAMLSRQDALEREHRLLRETARRRRILPYLDGMADRLRQRIRDLKPVEPTGTGLVVLKNQLIDAEMANEGINLNERSARASRDFLPDYLNGLVAADAVALNRGLRGGDTVAGRLAHQ